MQATQDHIDRIKSELRAAGVTAYGMLKSESRFLPSIIHPSETIEAVVYGQIGGGSAMLIATNLRVIFLDKKPFATLSDEITYGVISGIKQNNTPLPSPSITLHTRVGDYTVRYANPKCAHKFVEYIEQRVVEHTNGTKATTQKEVNPIMESIDQQAIAFLKSHKTGVLSTIDRSGAIHGTVIHFIADNDGTLHFMTKSGTQKAHNIFANSQVALTAYDEDSLQSVQLNGTAQVESDPEIKQTVYQTINALYAPKKRLPPVADLTQGAFMIVRITPHSAIFSDFSKKRDK